MTFSARDIDVLEGLEAVRRRPAMFIGHETVERTLRSRLVEFVLASFASGPPTPAAVRLIVWQGGRLTLAYDGEPLPIRSHEAGAGVAHPELYAWFLELTAPSSPLRFGAAVVNALSERLTVSTMRDGVRYRAAFQRGGLVSLLSVRDLQEVLGASWLTFAPDSAVVPGTVDVGDAERIAARVAQTANGVSVSVVDRSSEMPDWF